MNGLFYRVLFLCKDENGLCHGMVCATDLTGRRKDKTMLQMYQNSYIFK